MSMSRRKFLAAAIVLTTAVANVIPGSALACGLCLTIGGNPLALPHPKAIEIAVATRNAIDGGHLTMNPRVPSNLWHGEGTGWSALERIPPPQLVQGWAARLKVPGNDFDGLGVHILFIDTEHSCGLVIRKEAVLYETKTGNHCDAKAVMTRVAFYALVTGEVKISDAQQLGLLYLEGDKRLELFLAGTFTKKPGSE
jgi:hypothetical protein